MTSWALARWNVYKHLMVGIFREIHYELSLTPSTRAVVQMLALQVHLTRMWLAPKQLGCLQLRRYDLQRLGWDTRGIVMSKEGRV